MYVQQSVFRCSPHILKKSCPCKLCFKTLPGSEGCTGHAGAGDLLWGPGGIQPGGIHCAAGESGLERDGEHHTQGVMRSQCRGRGSGRDPETRRWAAELEKVGKQEMENRKRQRGGEERGGGVPAQVMLSGLPWEQELGSRGVAELLSKRVVGCEMGKPVGW